MRRRSIRDSELHGEPVVSNGMSLCRLRYAAFDRLLLGVYPDCAIDVRRDIFEEVDGPMMRHGVQGLRGKWVLVPSRVGLMGDEGRSGGGFWDG